MTPFCHSCGHRPSRLPLAVAVLAVLCVASLALGGFSLWHSERVQEQVSRTPKAEIHGGVHLHGATFGEAKYYEALKGYVATPQPIDTTPEPRKPERKEKK